MTEEKKIKKEPAPVSGDKDRSFQIMAPSPQVREMSQRILLVCLSATIYALEMNFFLAPAGLLPAGLAGMVRLIQQIALQFFHRELPYGVLYVLFNLPPALLAYRHVGKHFVLLSFLHVVVASVVIDLLPVRAVSDDMILLVVIAATMNGILLAMALNANASAGGTDFIAMLVSTKTGKPFWSQLFVFNAFLLTLSGFLFGWRPALYSIIYQFLSTTVVNKLHERYQRFTLMFVADQVEPLATDLMKLTRHGVTSLKGVGEYSGTERAILYMVVSKADMPAINQYLAQHGQHVFMNVMDSHELSGRFYLKPLD